MAKEFEINPNIGTVFGSAPAGTVEINGLYNDENSATISFDLGKNGCFEGKKGHSCHWRHPVGHILWHRHGVYRQRLYA